MDKISRKLQKIHESFYVNLPKAWINNMRLDKNSTIEIFVCNDGSLKLSPKLQHEAIEDKVVLNSKRYVARDVVKHCLAGTESVFIVSDAPISDEIKKDVKWFVEKLPNTEIIDEDKKKIEIHNFGYKSVPTKKAVQRLLYLACDMFENLRLDAIKDLELNYENLRRFYFILVIHIRTYLRTGSYVSEDKDFTPLEAMDYRLFCEKIERIGLILKELRLNENIKDFFVKIEKLYDETMKAFLAKNQITACEIWFKRNELIGEANELIKNLEYDDKDRIKEMLRIVEYCKDMADLI